MKKSLEGVVLVATIFALACNHLTNKKTEENNLSSSFPCEESFEDAIRARFKQNPDFIAEDFSFPLGYPTGKGYYNAQGFGRNAHLGEDWNAVTGGNSDLGHPIYAIGDGYVAFAQDIWGGWGKVLRIQHLLPNGSIYESLYAHCDTLLVKSGDWVKKGQNIATIGNAHGLYPAHLHLELRNDALLPIGGGYSYDTLGYICPSDFILSHQMRNDSCRD